MRIDGGGEASGHLAKRHELQKRAEAAEEEQNLLEVAMIEVGEGGKVDEMDVAFA